jgi:hypothetical protein
LPLDAIAFVDFGNAQSVTAFCHKGSFERVGLRHDQTVDIAVQYSTATAGTPVTVVPLDGGAIVASGKNLIVAADGTIKNTLGTQPRPPLAHRRKVLFEQRGGGSRLSSDDHLQLLTSLPIVTALSE